MRSLLWLFALTSLGLVAQPLTVPIVAGKVVGWGENVSGQVTGMPSYPLSNGVVVATGSGMATGEVAIAGAILTNVTAIAAGDSFGIGLMSNGTATGWGSNLGGAAVGYETPFPHRAAGLVKPKGRIAGNLVSVAAGREFGLALVKDGTVVSWGQNRVPNGLQGVSSIAARGLFSLALKRDGTLISWTSAPLKQSKAIPGLSNVVAISVGGLFSERSLALLKNGTVVAWGDETTHRDQTPPADLTNVVSIAAGYNHSLALKHDGTVVGWGFNREGQATGEPTTVAPYVASGLVKVGGRVLDKVVALAAGEEYSLALRGDGTVIGWGSRRRYSNVPDGLTNVVAISVGGGFCLALTTNSIAQGNLRSQ